MIQAVFFDLNGVLITSEFLSNRFEKTYGVSKEKFIQALKSVMSVVRKPDAPPMYALWTDHFSEWGLVLSESDFLQFWFSGESINNDALEYAKRLKEKGVKVLVVSNNFRERTQYYRSHFPELFENINAVYFSWETGFIKPSVDAINHALNEHNLNPSEVVYFDDSNENIEVAKSLGVDGQLWVDLETAKEYIRLKI
jgi:putative hydrolase of the HAD superfamily